MIVTVNPSSVKGIIHAAASKSSMQRACAAALLAKGKSIIKNPGCSNDDKAAIDIIQKLGASLQLTDEELILTSKGIHPVTAEVNCGESGLGIRMFTPIIALSEKEIIINGEGSLLARPMNFFDEIFPRLGVKYKSNDGLLPLIIQGPLQPRDIEIDGSLSSQFLTGLLMAYAAALSAANTLTKEAVIKVHNLKSKPYIDLTLDVMKKFGLSVPENNNYEEFIFHSDVEKDDTAQDERTYTVEGDWSGGAFLLVAAAIAGEADVHGLYNTSTQADKKIIDALLDCGADVQVSDDKVFVKRKKLEAFTFDATDCPDLFPPLVALAAHCEGVTVIRGLKRLKHKESNRGLTLKEEFDKLSIRIDLNDNEMLVHGNSGVSVKNHTLNSHHDHRIAMACAVACLRADFDVQIRNAEAVNKSYPDFWHHLQKLNAVVALSN